MPKTKSKRRRRHRLLSASTKIRPPCAGKVVTTSEEENSDLDVHDMLEDEVGANLQFLTELKP